MVGVDHQEQGQGGHGLGRGLIIPVGNREHHVQEIAAVAQVRVRVHERQPERLAVAEGGDGADLADELGHGHGELVHALDFEQFGVVVAQGVDDGRQDGHGLAAGRKAVEMVQKPLVEQFVLREQRAKRRTFFGGRQLAENQQHGHFDKRTALGQLFDGEAAVAQDALFAVDEGDGRLAGAGVGVAGIKGQKPHVLFQGGDVDAHLAFRPDGDGQFHGLVAIGQGGGLAFAHETPRFGERGGRTAGSSAGPAVAVRSGGSLEKKFGLVFPRFTAGQMPDHGQDVLPFEHILHFGEKRQEIRPGPAGVAGLDTVEEPDRIRPAPFRRRSRAA